MSCINRNREDEEGAISGGRFVNPGVLPPTRTAQIQGGRFIDQSALPPVRNYQIGHIGVDWEHSYHFSGMPNYRLE